VNHARGGENMDDLLFQDFLRNYLAGTVMKQDVDSSEFFHQCYEDSFSFRHQCYDGNFHDAIYSTLDMFKGTSELSIKYKDFLASLELELQKQVTRNIILIPMNNLAKESLPYDLRLSEEIWIFGNHESKYKLRRDKTALAKHVESQIYATLNSDHILITKDQYFFSHPTLAITVNAICSHVEIESSKIVEGVYAIIRLLDLKNEILSHRTSSHQRQINEMPASTYVVYYNDPDSSPVPPYDTGYGYSFRFSFQPFLDIADETLYKDGQLFTKLLQRYLRTFFRPPDVLETDLKELKWRNAILLFNTAYEMASIEKYDIANANLLSVLEMLFLTKSDRAKSAILMKLIPAFLRNTKSDVPGFQINNVISETYGKRNDYMHEGKGYISQKRVKHLHNLQGYIPGIRPFRHHTQPYDDYLLLRNLFLTVIEVLLNY
jgi:hypothetical protein